MKIFEYDMQLALLIYEITISLYQITLILYDITTNTEL